MTTKRKTSTPTPPAPPRPQDLRQALAQAEQARLQACQAELAELMARHGCQLSAWAEIKNGLIVAYPGIQLAPEKAE